MAAIERLIAVTPQGGLLGGLFWRAPSAGTGRARALREAKSLTSDATHYAQAQVGSHLRYGLFQPRASEEGLYLGKGVLAAAACFSRLVGATAPNAALVLTVAASGPRKEDKYFVVCLEDGVPAIDVLSNEIDARNALGGEDRPIWSDNPVAYPNSEPADFAWLACGADKNVRLQPIPVNPWPIVGLGLAAFAIVGGWMVVQHLRGIALARRVELAARAADPVPRYLAALASQRTHMAADREALIGAVAEMFDYRVRVPGWHLASAECSARRQACTRDWTRKGGSFDDLRQAVPKDTLEMLVPQGTTVPMLDVARTSHPIIIGRGDIPAGRGRLRTLQAAFSELGSQLQRWRTADVVIDFKRPTLWPALPDVPKGFQHPQAVLAGDADLRNVPAPFIVEAIRSSPDFVSWESVRVDIGEGSDPRSLLKFSASGVFYVAAR